MGEIRAFSHPVPTWSTSTKLSNINSPWILQGDAREKTSNSRWHFSHTFFFSLSLDRPPSHLSLTFSLRLCSLACTGHAERDVLFEVCWLFYSLALCSQDSHSLTCLSSQPGCKMCVRVDLCYCMWKLPLNLKSIFYITFILWSSDNVESIIFLFLVI